MDALILQELVWIKWAVVAIAVATGVIAIFALLALRAVALFPEMIQGRATFADRAKALLDQGKTAELLDLCDSHVLEFPADGHAYWYMGQASYRTGNLRRALICFRKVQALQPDWEAGHVQPMIAALEEKLGDRGEKPDLKVVEPIKPSEPDAPTDSPRSQ